MPDSINFDFGFPIPPEPPQPPPTQLWPARNRPELVVDAYRIMLADPQNNLIGFDTDWGRGGPLARIAYAGRSGTRDL